MSRTIEFTETVVYQLIDVPDDLTTEDAIQEWLDGNREAQELAVTERQVVSE